MVDRFTVTAPAPSNLRRASPAIAGATPIIVILLRWLDSPAAGTLSPTQAGAQSLVLDATDSTRRYSEENPSGPTAFRGRHAWLTARVDKPTTCAHTSSRAKRTTRRSRRD